MNTRSMPPSLRRWYKRLRAASKLESDKLEKAMRLINSDAPENPHGGWYWNDDVLERGWRAPTATPKPLTFDAIMEALASIGNANRQPVLLLKPGPVPALNDMGDSDNE